MYALQTSQDGKNFNHYFQKGRLRKYESMQNALNASKQLLNNPKNNINTILIYTSDFKDKLAFVKKDNEGNFIVEHTKFKFNEGGLDIPKEDMIEINVTKKIIPIESLIEKPSEKDRVDSKKKETKEFNKESIKRGNCLNNLSSVKLDRVDDSLYESFMEALVEHSIETNNYRSLFYAECKLSQKGYSWYVDKDSNIRVRQTEKVIEFLNESRHV